eukprot:1056364-Prorocentrum_minimum.AAC.2
MPGSDIVTANVIDGVATATDRFAVAKSMPESDCSQDWTVVSGSEVRAFFSEIGEIHALTAELTIYYMATTTRI